VTGLTVTQPALLPAVQVHALELALTLTVPVPPSSGKRVLVAEVENAQAVVAAATFE
jgi:hypothetical protein